MKLTKLIERCRFLVSISEEEEAFKELYKKLHVFTPRIKNQIIQLNRQFINLKKDNLPIEKENTEKNRIIQALLEIISNIERHDQINQKLSDSKRKIVFKISCSVLILLCFPIFITEPQKQTKLNKERSQQQHSEGNHKTEVKSYDNPKTNVGNSISKVFSINSNGDLKQSTLKMNPLNKAITEKDFVRQNASIKNNSLNFPNPIQSDVNRDSGTANNLVEADSINISIKNKQPILISATDECLLQSIYPLMDEGNWNGAYRKINERRDSKTESVLLRLTKNTCLFYRIYKDENLEDEIIKLKSQIINDKKILIKNIPGISNDQRIFLYTS